MTEKIKVKRIAPGTWVFTVPKKDAWELTKEKKES